MSPYRRPARPAEHSAAPPTRRELWQHALHSFDTRAYVQQIRSYGRASLSDAIREQLSMLNSLAVEAARECNVPDRALAGLVDTLARAEAAQCSGRLPTYTEYANLHVLELCLGVHSPPDSAGKQSARIWRAVDVLLADLATWADERNTAATMADQPAGTGRVTKIGEIRRLVPAGYRDNSMPQSRSALPTKLSSYVAEDFRLALTHLTALPRTTVPDEYLLIRGIQVCEAAFWGALLHIQQALKTIATEPKAAAALNSALQFTELFLPTLHLVRTIPTQTFAGFADQASAAIAVDSLSYQTLEAHIYGVLPEKRQLVSEMPHARRALEYDTEAFQPLLRFIDQSEMSELIRRVERRVYTWKTYHERKLAAGGYLLDEGGPESVKGPAFLARQRPPRPQRVSTTHAQTNTVLPGGAMTGPAHQPKPGIESAADDYRRDGVVVVRNLLDADDVDVLRCAVDGAGRALASRSAGDAKGFWNRSHLLDDEPSLRRVLLGSALCEAVSTVIASSRLWLYEDTALVKEPGHDEGTPWHQDLVHYPVDGQQVATAWIALDTVDMTNGVVYYVAGSHMWGRTFEPVAFADGRRYPAPAFEPVPNIDVAEAISFDTQPGDVVIHHGLILHGSPRSAIARRRRALAVTYLGDDVVVGRTHFPHHHPISDALPDVGQRFQHLLHEATPFRAH